MSSTGQGNGLALTIGANIRLAREERDLFQRELAAKLGVGAQQVSDWERGTYRPNDKNLIRISEVLEKDFVWFFTAHEPERNAA